jgi:hypothetical protein
MSNDKALAIVPQTIDEVRSMAVQFARSALLPIELRGKEADVFVTLLAGQELGMPPMAAMRGIHVVKGKTVLSADAMVGVVLGRGIAKYFNRVEESPTSVTYETWRTGDPTPIRCTWSDDDSARAGLLSNDNYRKYPKAMRQARCKAMLARDVYPDVLAGCYDIDEAREFDASTALRAVPPSDDTVDAVDAEIVEETKAAPAAAARTETAAPPPPSGPSLVTRILAAPSLEALAALGDEVRKLKGSERAEAIEAGKRRQAELQELAAAPPPDVSTVTAPATAIPTGPELDIITADIITRVEAAKVVSDVAVLMKEIGARLPVGSPQRKRAREAADAQVEKLTPAKTAKR